MSCLWPLDSVDKKGEEMDKMLNDIAKSKDDDYLKNGLLIANAMMLPTTIQSVDGDQLVFVDAQFSSEQEQFIPSLDMDQNVRVFNWLCEHGTLRIAGNEARLILEDTVLIVTSHGKGLFRQQLIVDLAVKLALTKKLVKE